MKGLQKGYLFCKLHGVEPWGRCNIFFLSPQYLCFMHLSSASPKGGGDPGLMWGLFELCISKFLYFPTRGAFFFLQSPQYLAKPSTQLDLKMHFRTLFWFFEQLANTRTLHSDENWTSIIFSWILHKVLAVWWKFQHFVPSWIPQILFLNLSGLMKNKGKHSIMMVHCCF